MKKTKLEVTEKVRIGTDFVSDSGISPVFEAEVTKIDNYKVMVVTNDKEIIETTLAFSCLVKLEVKDKVLVVSDDKHNYYLISIIKRNVNKSVQLNIENLVFNTDNVAFISKASITMSSPKFFHEADEYNMIAQKASMNLENMNYVSKKSSVFAKNIEIVSSFIFSSIVNMMQKFDFLNKTVNKLSIEHTKAKNMRIDANYNISAGSVNLKAKHNYSVTSRQTFMN